MDKIDFEDGNPIYWEEYRSVRLNSKFSAVVRSRAWLDGRFGDFSPEVTFGSQSGEQPSSVSVASLRFVVSYTQVIVAYNADDFFVLSFKANGDLASFVVRADGRVRYLYASHGSRVAKIAEGVVNGRGECDESVLKSVSDYVSNEYECGEAAASIVLSWDAGFEFLIVKDLAGDQSGYQYSRRPYARRIVSGYNADR